MAQTKNCAEADHKPTSNDLFVRVGKRQTRQNSESRGYEVFLGPGGGAEECLVLCVLNM